MSSSADVLLSSSDGISHLHFYSTCRQNFRMNSHGNIWRWDYWKLCNDFMAHWERKSLPQIVSITCWDVIHMLNGNFPFRLLLHSQSRVRARTIDGKWRVAEENGAGCNGKYFPSSPRLYWKTKQFCFV